MKWLDLFTLNTSSIYTWRPAVSLSRLITRQSAESESEIHVAHMHGAGGGGFRKIDRHLALPDSDLCLNWSGADRNRLGFLSCF